jgi:sigma-B regulation protein RsbU (phosphoserine phosphatase)
MRDVVFQDVRPGEIPASLRENFRQIYRFYLDEDRRAELESMGWVRRNLKRFWWLLKSLLSKLSPGRRLALAAAMVMALVGNWQFSTGHVRIDFNLRGWAFVFVLVILMLELKDKLLARSEIEVARQVQIALLPRTHPQPEGWSIWALTRPANDVGADLVDYLDLPDGRLGIVLADVAGKGLGAALLTAKVQATLRAVVPEVRSLADLGARLNAILFRDGIDNRFVTLFYFEIDRGSGRVRYLNAGHNPPFVVRAGGVVETIEPSSIPLGMMADCACREGSLSLEAGDLIVVYSDGLTEATDAAGREFGADRLRALLPALRGLPSEEIVARVSREVNGFLGGLRPHDDLSLIVAGRSTPIR